ncbi:hypothetical protein CGMCC3_g13956 [Colletotrichum fructicola]|nr:uncharacterized protein CGMCC3_g13956 [Colletotrichum fructicola]KAE9569941.1 hypothetical protein CGMCC3_g13956 [Colletotrichum fructicola]
MGSFVEELLSDICNLEKAPEVPRLNRGVSTKHAFNYLAYARGSKQKTTKPGSARWMLDYRQKRALLFNTEGGGVSPIDTERLSARSPSHPVSRENQKHEGVRKGKAHMITRLVLVGAGVSFRVSISVG